MIETNAVESPQSYTVELPIFQGPLDLLLSLIEQQELDITKISLAQVTDQYLAYLDVIRDTNPDEITDFLIIAAKLIYIKSSVLLPKPPPSVAEEEEEDLGDELARQLRLYKKFKELAAHLRELEETGRRNFVRLAPPPRLEPKLIPGEVTLDDLLAAARQAFAVKPPDPVVDEVVSPVTVTIGQQMTLIRRELSTGRRVTFRQLLSRQRNRIEVIVTLLAILELIKRRVIRAQQPEMFGDIILEPDDHAAELTET
ncbi:MAG: chromosome segregation protein ScpA, partial [Chloroflexi bacterium]